jgi:hypothetical protein
VNYTTEAPGGLPTINLHGASRESLIRQYQLAYDNLIMAMDALSILDIHPRDYQANPEDYDIAIAYKGESLMAMFKLKDYLRSVLYHLRSQ